MDVNKINTVISVIENGLHDRTRPWHVFFGRAESWTGANRFRLLVFTVIGLCFYLILGHGAAVSSNVIGFAYPALATLALTDRIYRQRSDAADGRVVAVTKKEIDRWYTYWLTFVAILIAENHFGFVLSLVPFYRLMKTLFLVWCAAPIKKNGSAVIYSNVIIPCFSAPTTAVSGY